MTKLLLILLINISTEVALANTAIMTLLDREIATIEGMKKNKKLSSHHLHRLVELYSEKCKLIRENENKAFFEDVKQGQVKDKAYYYHRTPELYARAAEAGKELLKVFPQYSKKAEVLYTMALNARDYGEVKTAEEYFLSALKEVGQEKNLKFQIESSLGDYYYNEKIYDKAKKVYEIVLENKQHEWWGKYAYNYAWSLLKLEHNQKALSFMLQAYDESKKKTSINIKDQIIQNIGVFFYYAKELDKSLSFYHSESKEFTDLAIKMGTLLMKKGHLKESEKYLLDTLNLAQSSKEVTQTKLALLELYREKSDVVKHTNIAQELRSLKTEITVLDRIGDYIYNLKLMIKDMQNSLKRKPERVDLAHNIVKDYDALIEFDPKLQVSYLFYSGESLFGANLYDESLKYYHRAILKSELQDKEYLNLSFESMLGVYKLLPKEKLNETELVAVYVHYLKIAPKDTHSSYAYKKLFMEYHRTHNYDLVESIINQYHTNFPQEIEFQRDMQTKYVQTLIEKTNVPKLRQWVMKIDQGYLSFAPEYRQKIWNILGNILLNSAGSEKPSEATLALVQEIYAQPKFESSIRIKASYNTAVAFLRLNQSREANDWLMKTLTLLSDDEVKKLYPDLVGFLSGYFLNEDNQSIEILGTHLISFYCDKDKTQLENVYRLVSEQLMIGNSLDSTLTIREKVKNCPHNTFLDKSDLILLGMSFEKRNFETFEKIYALMQESEETDVRYFKMIEGWARTYAQAAKRWGEIKSDEKHSKHPYFLAKVAEIKSQDIEAELKLVQTLNLSALEKNFDEAVFAQTIQEAIQKVASLNASLVEVTKLKNNQVNYRLLETLSQTYLILGETFKGFKPKIDDENYRWSIRTTMREMRKKLLSEEKVVAKKLKELAPSVKRVPAAASVIDPKIVLLDF